MPARKTSKRKSSAKQPLFTPEHALQIIDAHGIDIDMENEEEAELLKANSPELYDAYVALLTFAKQK